MQPGEEGRSHTHTQVYIGEFLTTWLIAIGGGGDGYYYTKGHIKGGWGRSGVLASYHT